jgi:hypothetical protein
MKNVWLLWLQGWDNAPWLQQQVSKSWRLHNPTWTVHHVSLDNLKEYITDVDYIYDTTKDISPASKSDIIRLSLLKNHGGVWADSTMLCMQSLDTWIDTMLTESIWMYHGHGGNMPKEIGPASWFIVSRKDGYVITQWKQACDDYWKTCSSSLKSWWWMDLLFKKLYETDDQFRTEWSKVPYIYCELDGQSHCLARNNRQYMSCSLEHIKELFRRDPPFALKFWSSWHSVFPDVTSARCKQSNGYYAIQLALKEV